MAQDASVADDHDSYGQIEQQFQEAMDEGLNPAGPDVLYDLAAGLGPAAGAAVLDVGCGVGRHSIQLTRRLGLTVRGVDPNPRSLEIARQALDRASQGPSRPGATGQLRAGDSPEPARRCAPRSCRYISQFGQGNFDIALGDYLWQVYRMIGKLSGRSYLLTAPQSARIA